MIHISIYNTVIVLYLKPHHHHDGQFTKWTLSNLLSNLPLLPGDCSQSSSLWLPLLSNAAVHVHIGDLLGKVSRGPGGFAWDEFGPCGRLGDK